MNRIGPSPLTAGGSGSDARGRRPRPQDEAAFFVIGFALMFGGYSFPNHNIPMALMGVIILPFGWFGFNAH